MMEESNSSRRRLPLAEPGTSNGDRLFLNTNIQIEGEHVLSVRWVVAVVRQPHQSPVTTTHIIIDNHIFGRKSF